MRFEIKFAYPPHFEGEVRNWLLSHSCLFSQAYPVRRVQNVYFDTFDLQAFGENLAESVGAARSGFAGTAKTVFFRPAHSRSRTSTVSWVGRTVASSKQPHFKPATVGATCAARSGPPCHTTSAWYFDEYPQTILINRYTRSYLESRDRRLRVTLDSEQEMFDQMRSQFPNVSRRTNIPDVHVLELKCDAEHKQLATRALGTCPVRGSRFSKYTVGVELR